MKNAKYNGTLTLTLPDHKKAQHLGIVISNRLNDLMYPLYATVSVMNGVVRLSMSNVVAAHDPSQDLASLFNMLPGDIGGEIRCYDTEGALFKKIRGWVDHLDAVTCQEVCSENTAVRIEA